MKTKMATLILTGVLTTSFYQVVALASENNTKQELIKRGEYLVGYGGCND